MNNNNNHSNNDDNNNIDNSNYSRNTNKHVNISDPALWYYVLYRIVYCSIAQHGMAYHALPWGLGLGRQVK